MVHTLNIRGHDQHADPWDYCEPHQEVFTLPNDLDPGINPGQSKEAKTSPYLVLFRST